MRESQTRNGEIAVVVNLGARWRLLGHSRNDRGDDKAIVDRHDGLDSGR